MQYAKLVGAVAGIIVFGVVESAAQPSYYDSRARQNAEYRNLSNATNRAYSVPDRPASSAPSRSSSSSSNTSSGSNTRSSSGGSYGNSGSTAPAYSAPAKPVKTNAEILEEHNAWLRKVRSEENAERDARTANYIAAQKAAEVNKQASANEAERAPQVKALASSLEALGFSPTESFVMAYRSVPQVNGATPTPPAELKRMQDAREALEQFTKASKSAKFRELSALALRLDIATITSLTIQQSLAARFPDNARETELAELLAMPYIWGGTKTLRTPMMYERATDAEKREVADRYKELAEKYPQEATYATSLYDYDALQRLKAALGEK